MASWRRAVGYGLLVWLIPFAVAFSISSVKESWRSLFESVMAVMVAIAVVVFANLYFRRATRRGAVEGIKLGLLWMAISIAIDLPLMLGPPLNYSPLEYLADVGLTYLMMPVITIGIGLASASPATLAQESD
jgi:Na+/proline symporter